MGPQRRQVTLRSGRAYVVIVGQVTRRQWDTGGRFKQQREAVGVGGEGSGLAGGLLSTLGLRVQKCQQLAFLHHLQVTFFAVPVAFYLLGTGRACYGV